MLGLCTCFLILLTAVAAITTFLIRIREAVYFPNKYRLKCLALGAAGVIAMAAATGTVNELRNEGEQKFWVCLCLRPVRVSRALGGQRG